MTTRAKWLLALLGALCSASYATWHFNSIILEPYTRYAYTPVSAAAIGATAPTRWTIGTTYGGQGFDDANDEVFITYEMPDDWQAGTSAYLRIYWTNEPGTAIANTKKVIWASSYRSRGTDGDLDSDGTSTTGATYTQSGAGTDGTMHVSVMTIAWNDANNPLAKDYVLGFSLKRDTTTEAGDTYPADAIIIAYEFQLQSIGVPNH